MEHDRNEQRDRRDHRTKISRHSRTSRPVHAFSLLVHAATVRHQQLNIAAACRDPEDERHIAGIDNAQRVLMQTLRDRACCKGPIGRMERDTFVNSRN